MHFSFFFFFFLLPQQLIKVLDSILNHTAAVAAAEPLNCFSESLD
jgi:hypothetical protein